MKQETDPDILNELPIQNLSIQEDRDEQEKLQEMTDTLVPPPEVAVVTLMPEEMEWEDIIEGKEAEGLTEQEQKLQEDKVEYAIYVARISEEEESNMQMNSLTSFKPRLNLKFIGEHYVEIHNHNNCMQCACIYIKLLVES